MEKILKYLAVLLAAALVFGAARFLDNGPGKKEESSQTSESSVSVWSESETEDTAAETETEAQEKRFRLTFAGDCTLGCRQMHSYTQFGFNKVVGEDYGYPFRNVQSYFETDDFTFLNLEGALCDEQDAVIGENSFRGPAAYVNMLTGSSVEAVSLANEHTMDCGQKGYDATKANLDSAGVSYVERDNAVIVTLDSGLTVGIYGAVYYLLDTNEITKALEALREQADLVIFAPHWGFAKNYTPSQEQLDLAHAAIDAGADIVFGCHPGVLQPVEEYNGGIIYYSLGSFSYGGNIYPEDYDSALIQQEVILAADGSLFLGQMTAVPVSISTRTDRNDFQPVPYEADSEGYTRVMKKLGLA